MKWHRGLIDWLEYCIRQQPYYHWAKTFIDNRRDALAKDTRAIKKKNIKKSCKTVWKDDWLKRGDGMGTSGHSREIIGWRALDSPTHMGTRQ